MNTTQSTSSAPGDGVTRRDQELIGAALTFAAEADAEGRPTDADRWRYFAEIAANPAAPWRRTAPPTLSPIDEARPRTPEAMTRGALDETPRYQVARTDGRDAEGERHHGCAYFVLDLTHDPMAEDLVSAYFGDLAEARVPYPADADVPSATGIHTPPRAVKENP